MTDLRIETPKEPVFGRPLILCRPLHDLFLKKIMLGFYIKEFELDFIADDSAWGKVCLGGCAHDRNQ